MLGQNGPNSFKHHQTTIPKHLSIGPSALEGCPLGGDFEFSTPLSHALQVDTLLSDFERDFDFGPSFAYDIFT